LRDSATVVDLGCGDMNLERHLQDSQRYIPVDFIRRDQRTAVMDVERDDFSPITGDACAMLGLLEYIYDPPSLLAAVAAHFPKIVLSYNLSIGAKIEHRLAHGWVNHYAQDELFSLIAGVGLAILDQVQVNQKQRLFLLSPVFAP
jgi:hypothetical protein